MRFIGKVNYSGFKMIKIIFLSLLIFFSPLYATEPLSSQHLHTLNTLTMRRASSLRPKYKIVTIDQLVRYINSNHEIPFRTHLEINNILHTVYRGIHISPKDTTVFIFSRGYAKTNIPGTNDNFIQRGACATAAHIQLRDHIVTDAPLISFDYDDSKNGFSFGQTNEINALELIYNGVLEKNPAATIVLIGDCRGGKVALELAIKRPPNLKALILMAPFTSARDLTNMIADHYISYLPFSRALLHHFFRFYFPRYNQKEDTLAKRLKYVPADLPIFIAHRQEDTLVSMETIKKLTRSLKKTGNPDVRLVTIQDTSYPHSMLTGNQAVQYGINTFLKDHGLPYYNELV